MKNTLFLLTIGITFTHAEFSLSSIAEKAYKEVKSHITIDEVADTFLIAKEYIEEIKTGIPKQRVKRTPGHLKFPLNNKTLFSQNNCDRVIKNEAYTSCYNDRYKGSRFLKYTLTRSDLQSNYIPREDGGSELFTTDYSLPSWARAYTTDYTHSGYDRGHSRSYASSAYSMNMINLTYSMINILPQTPELNRYRWTKVEKYERLLARKLGKVEVINIALYSKNPKYIGKHRIAIPNAFYKIIFSQENKLKRCFYYENSFKKIKRDKLKDHRISCDKVYY